MPIDHQSIPIETDPDEWARRNRELANQSGRGQLNRLMSDFVPSHPTPDEQVERRVKQVLGLMQLAGADPDRGLAETIVSTLSKPLT